MFNTIRAENNNLVGAADAPPVLERFRHDLARSSGIAGSRFSKGAVGCGSKFARSMANPLCPGRDRLPEILQLGVVGPLHVVEQKRLQPLDLGTIAGIIDAV